MIATPETLYLADDDVLQAAGRGHGRVARARSSRPRTTGPSGNGWRWTDGVLYALVGSEETPDPTVRGDRRAPRLAVGSAAGSGLQQQGLSLGFRPDDSGHRSRDRSKCSGGTAKRNRWIRAPCAWRPGGSSSTATASSWVRWTPRRAKCSGAIADAESCRRSASIVSPRTPARVFPRRPTSSATTRPCTSPVRPAPTWSPFRPRTASLLWRQAGGGNSQLVLRHEGLYAMGPRPEREVRLSDRRGLRIARAARQLHARHGQRGQHLRARRPRRHHAVRPGQPHRSSTCARCGPPARTACWWPRVICSGDRGCATAI